MDDRSRKLKEAISEAKRFIQKAENALSVLKADEYPDMVRSAETAAARRASLDLTRALANLRKT